MPRSILESQRMRYFQILIAVHQYLLLYMYISYCDGMKTFINIAMSESEIWGRVVFVSDKEKRETLWNDISEFCSECILLAIWMLVGNVIIEGVIDVPGTNENGDRMTGFVVSERWWWKYMGKTITATILPLFPCIPLIFNVFLILFFCFVQLASKFPYHLAKVAWVSVPVSINEDAL